MENVVGKLLLEILKEYGSKKVVGKYEGQTKYHTMEVGNRLWRLSSSARLFKNQDFPFADFLVSWNAILKYTIREYWD